jgi:hypothetical protein
MYIAAVPDPSQSVAFFIRGPVKFTPAILGNISLVSNLSSLVFSFCQLKGLRLICSLHAVVCNINSILLMLIVCRTTFMVFPDEYLSYVSGLITSAIGIQLQIAFVTECAKCARKSHEGMEFSLYVSVPLIGSLIGYVFSYILTLGFQIDHDDFSNLGTFCWYCDMLFITTLLVPLFIDKRV